MKQIIQKNPIIAILRHTKNEFLIPYVTALANGGIKALEIAMNTENAPEQISILKNHFGNTLLIGAGTAISKERILLARSAGADFFLTPGVQPELLDYCAKEQIKLLPGVMTPSDVELCLSFGFNTLKLFPADSVPDNYIKSLKGPFNTTDFVAVGGVSLENILSLFKNGYIGAGIGSNLVPHDIFETKDWERAAIYIKKYTDIAEQFFKN